MDRRTLLAITLSFAIFVLWQKFYLEPMTAPRGAPTSTQIGTAPVSPPPAATAPTRPEASMAPGAPKAPAERPHQELSLDSGTGKVLLNNGPFLLSGWDLKGYRVGVSAETATVDLRSVTNQEGEVLLGFDDASLAYLNQQKGDLTKTPQGALWSYDDANVSIRREIKTSPDQGYLDVVIETKFKSKAPRFAFVSISSQAMTEDPEEVDRQLLYWTRQDIERVQAADVKELKDIPTTVKYIGAASRYFLLALVPHAGTEPRGILQPVGPKAGRLSLVYPVSGDSVSIPLRVYFGPKELETMRKVEPLLDHTLDFGWFTAFAYPLLKLLQWFYKYVGNYGIAIVLLTLLLKIVTYPLTYKSMKSMKEMAKIQPQIQRVREKHKNDKEAMNREMLTLMKSHGYNPMAGCLPILIQMPIFFALYRVLYSSIELYHAPFALWIIDLSSKDPFYVTPVLLSITMFIQQKLTPTTAMDPTQAKMMQMMPLIFGAFMLALPSGLTLYMLVNAIASIAQQMILNKKLGTTPNVSPAPAKAR